MKKTYITPKFEKSNLNINQGIEGELLEQKINRIVRNKEPIKDGAPLVYTERRDGVNPAYNIRTDRFDLAIDAMDKYASSITAQRKSKEKSAETEPNTSTSEGTND